MYIVLVLYNFFLKGLWQLSSYDFCIAALIMKIIILIFVFNCFHMGIKIMVLIKNLFSRFNYFPYRLNGVTSIPNIFISVFDIRKTGPYRGNK